MTQDNHTLAMNHYQNCIDDAWDNIQPALEAMLPLYNAAPDLLAACEVALVTLEDEYPECVQGDYKAFSLLRAAIAKARGEA